MFQVLALLSRYHCRSLWRFANSVILTHLGAVFVPRQQPDTLRSPMVPLSMPLKLRFNITPEVKRDIENAKQNMNMYLKAL